MRALRRVAVALALTAPLLVLVPSPAQATTCTTQVPPLPPANYPCFGPEDQPVGAPAWVATEYGPGWGFTREWAFIKILQGGHIVLANVSWPDPIRFYGPGFDSGYLPMGSATDVSGVASLAPGHYPIYADNGAYTGDLFVEAVPSPVCLSCL
jgi:hypothetical protein